MVSVTQARTHRFLTVGRPPRINYLIREEKKDPSYGANRRGPSFLVATHRDKITDPQDV